KAVAAAPVIVPHVAVPPRLASEYRPDRTSWSSGGTSLTMTALMPPVAILAVGTPEVIPVAEPPIPGAFPVVAVPIGAQREGHDRHVDFLDVARQIDIAPAKQ